jgi:uncharacterized membrane protein
MSDPNEPVAPTGSGDEATPPPPPPPSDSPYGEPGGTDPGGYGAPPPPPYGQTAPDPYGGSGAYSPTEALSYGWRKFSASPATLLVPMIVVFVGIVVVAVIVELAIFSTLTSTHSCTDTIFGQRVQTQCGPGLLTRLFAAGLAGAIINLVAQLLAAGLYKGATHVTDGKPFSLGMMFEGWDKTQVVIASAIIAVATFVGTILCYFPALIVGFLTQYTLLFIVDKQLSAVDAIRASVKFVTDNLGSTLVFYILAVIVLAIGAILCGVGLLVAAPVALIGLAYTFRRLQNEPVVA